MSVATNIVDRLHVSRSNLDVIRAIRRAMKPRARWAPALRATRKRMYREGIKRHRANRDLYSRVMRGGF